MRRKYIWILAVALLSYNMNAVAAGLTPDATDLTDNGETSEASSGEEIGAEVLYNVSFPTDIHAFLDPGDLSGRGQIFSDRYEVKNYGNTDVVIKIKNIDVYYISTEDIYELSDEEIVDNNSRIKKLNINMVWVNEAEQTEKVLCVSEGVYDECVLSLAASEYNENGEFVDLREGSSGFFYFTGTLNSNPNLIWEDGEVTACFDYEIVKAGNEEEKADTEEVSEPQDITADINDENNQNHPENAGETVDPETVEEKTGDVTEHVKAPEGAADKEEQESGGDIQEIPADEGPKENQEETNQTANETEEPATDVIEKEDGTVSNETTVPDTDIKQEEETLNNTEQADTAIDTEENGTVPEKTGQPSADTEKKETSEEPEKKGNEKETSGTETKNSQ